MLNRFLQPYTGIAYALLRIVSGLLLMIHGLQKFGMFGGTKVELMSQMGLGAVIEAVCGALVMLGLFTSPAAFVLSGTMLVAYAQFKWRFRFDENLSPIVNDGELPLIYCLVFLYIACSGSGPFSVDRARGANPRPAAI